MIFKYNNQYIAQNDIDITDIGNFALEGINEEDGFFYYLIMKTKLGTSSIFSFGPVIPDSKLLADEYKLEYKRAQFKDKFINKYISLWLNDREKKLSNAQVIDENTALEQFKDIKEYILNYSDEVY